jgi:regulator of sigma E protease
MPVDLLGQLVERKKAMEQSERPIISPRIPVIVMNVDSNSNAFKAGIRKSDRVLTVNQKTAEFRYDYEMAMDSLKKGSEVMVTLERKGVDTVIVQTVLPEDGRLGFISANLPEQFDSLGVYDFVETRYSFFSAFPAGFKKAGKELNFYIGQFKKILNPQTGGIKGVGGFKAMGSAFPGNGWDWQHFWNITAFFSIVLAFMNLLPIPALDGGHVMFTLYEMITGRKPNEKFLEYAQIAGMILLLALMLYANGNDWFGWGK